MSNLGCLQNKEVYHEEIRSKTICSALDRHQKLLKLQGKAQKTIEAYSRAVLRIRDHTDCIPDQLKQEQLENYFVELVERYSWSTIKLDRFGLMFFWKHVLGWDWQWLDIVKPPKVQIIPDILTPVEIQRLIEATKKLRYRVFILATYPMRLRLEEARSLQVDDLKGGLSCTPPSFNSCWWGWCSSW